MATAKETKPKKATVKKVVAPVVEEVEETPVVKEGEYVLTITLADRVLTGTGSTTLEALKSIEPPVKIFTKANIVLVCGDKHMLQTWQPHKLKRLFYPIAQPLLAKQLEYLLR